MKPGHFSRTHSIAARLFGGLLDGVYPPLCVLCRALADRQPDPLCASCAGWVETEVAAPHCPRCGARVAPHAGPGPACATCARQRFPFDSVACVGAYAGRWRALITAFKFGGREELDAYFARRLARVIARLSVYDELDAVVAVPTCWQHRLRRPFHPAVVVGRLAARISGIPYAPLLERTGGGHHQLGLPFTQRQVNVRGKFRLARGCRAPGARLLLVDDVMTTGATASECTRVLRAGGAREVHVAVLARAGDDPVSLRHI